MSNQVPNTLFRDHVVLRSVPTSMICMERPADRLMPGEGQAALTEAIRQQGQLVPVLLREMKGSAKRYRLVYGRRRLAACETLGIHVRALITQVDDAGAVIAQGQENAARRDLSFIEKASFARRIKARGFDRQVICAALDIDKSLLSRLLAVADAIPRELVAAIGPAPAVGRARWLQLAKRLAASDLGLRETGSLARGKDSNARFEAVLRGLQPVPPATAKPQKPAPDVRRIAAPGGPDLGEAERLGDRLILTLSATASSDFGPWLLRLLPELHARFARDAA